MTGLRFLHMPDGININFNSERSSGLPKENRARDGAARVAVALVSFMLQPQQDCM
jgi:hypothetical protein